MNCNVTYINICIFYVWYLYHRPSSAIASVKSPAAHEFGFLLRSFVLCCVVLCLEGLFNKMGDSEFQQMSLPTMTTQLSSLADAVVCADGGDEARVIRWSIRWVDFIGSPERKVRRICWRRAFMGCGSCREAVGNFMRSFGWVWEPLFGAYFIFLRRRRRRK